MSFLLMLRDIEESNMRQILNSCRSKVVTNNKVICKIPYISQNNKKLINKFIEENINNGIKVSISKHKIIIRTKN